MARSPNTTASGDRLPGDVDPDKDRRQPRAGETQSRQQVRRRLGAQRIETQKAAVADRRDAADQTGRDVQNEIMPANHRSPSDRQGHGSTLSENGVKANGRYRPKADIAPKTLSRRERA